MTRRVAPLCAILIMLTAVLLGCSTGKPAPVEYTLRTARDACGRPASMPLITLDDGKRLEHPVNLAMLTLGNDLMAEQIVDQDNALDCYEAQGRGGQR